MEEDPELPSTPGPLPNAAGVSSGDHSHGGDHAKVSRG